MSTSITYTNGVQGPSMSNSTPSQLSRTYATDLPDNLKLTNTINPGYICGQPFIRCDTVKNEQEKQKCEAYWSQLCPQK